MSKEEPLTPKNELFCQLYAGAGQRSLMSNGVLCYLEAFDIDTPTGKVLQKKLLPKTKGQKKPKYLSYWDYTREYKNAAQAAHTLLINPDIKARIFTLFKNLFTADVVDSELLKAIMQQEDWGAKVMAVKQFNELKGRIIKKIKLSGELKSTLPATKLAQIAEQVLKASKKK